MSGLTWLQRQQLKLRERKDSVRRQERHPTELRLITELRAAQGHKAQPQHNGSLSFESKHHNNNNQHLHNNNNSLHQNNNKNMKIHLQQR